jgi:hypothetical protein
MKKNASGFVPIVKATSIAPEGVNFFAQYAQTRSVGVQDLSSQLGAKSM